MSVDRLPTGPHSLPKRNVILQSDLLNLVGRAEAEVKNRFTKVHTNPKEHLTINRILANLFIEVKTLIHGIDAAGLTVIAEQQAFCRQIEAVTTRCQHDLTDVRAYKQRGFVRQALRDAQTEIAQMFSLRVAHIVRGKASAGVTENDEKKSTDIRVTMRDALKAVGIRPEEAANEMGDRLNGMIIHAAGDFLTILPVETPAFKSKITVEEINAIKEIFREFRWHLRETMRIIFEGNLRNEFSVFQGRIVTGIASFQSRCVDAAVFTVFQKWVMEPIAESIRKTTSLEDFVHQFKPETRGLHEEEIGRVLRPGDYPCSPEERARLLDLWAAEPDKNTRARKKIADILNDEFHGGMSVRKASFISTIIEGTESPFEKSGEPPLRPEEDEHLNIFLADLQGNFTDANACIEYLESTEDGQRSVRSVVVHFNETYFSGLLVRKVETLLPVLAKKVRAMYAAPRVAPVATESRLTRTPEQEAFLEAVHREIDAVVKHAQDLLAMVEASGGQKTLNRKLLQALVTILTDYRNVLPLSQLIVFKTLLEKLLSRHVRVEKIRDNPTLTFTIDVAELAAALIGSVSQASGALGGETLVAIMHHLDRLRLMTEHAVRERDTLAQHQYPERIDSLGHHIRWLEACILDAEGRKAQTTDPMDRRQFDDNIAALKKLLDERKKEQDNVYGNCEEVFSAEDRLRRLEETKKRFLRRIADLIHESEITL